MLQSKEYQHFRTAVQFTLILSLLLAVFVAIFGKEGSFLLINRYHSPVFDRLFMYGTYMGHGMIWVPLFLYTILFKREFLIAVISGLIICTVLTHGMKIYLFPDVLRPIGILSGQVRTIENLTVHYDQSFPSGHTSTAFTLALLLSFRLGRAKLAYLLPLVGFFVAFSRLYLAQHFLTDVLGGILVGIASAWLSLRIYKVWKERRGKPIGEQGRKDWEREADS